MARWASSQAPTAGRQAFMAVTGRPSLAPALPQPRSLRSQYHAPGADAMPEPPRALILALLCIVYLLNLSGGWLEIPDCLPVVGNLDEAAAAAALIRCLGRLGWTGVPGPR